MFVVRCRCLCDVCVLLCCVVVFAVEIDDECGLCIVLLCVIVQLICICVCSVAIWS